MTDINFSNVSLDFPILNAKSKSLTSRALSLATGGRLDSDSSGRVHVRALDNLNFEIHEGERVAILGHNGAGKTSLLRVLSGVYLPTSGEALIQGETESLIDIGLGINHEATGRENIYLRGRLLGLTKKEIDERFIEIVEFSELGEFIELPVRTYSTGMQLRLAFAIATVVRPEILIMDEWLSVGDEDFRFKSEKRLNEVLNKSKIFILASHSRELVERVCARGLWLDHGKIVMDDEINTVTREYFGA